jgi:predicted nucleic acid-binding protein
VRGANEFIPLSDAAVERGEALKGMGLETYDALHIACAEHAQVDVLLTTDDRLLRAATRHAPQLNVRIENPLTWLQEVLRDE